MKRVVLVQARMTSTRLPGKVLADIAGVPMLAQQLRRLNLCEKVDDVIVATTTNPSDIPIVELARRERAGWFCGSEHDVLSRFINAAQQAKADVIVRVTADCPLIDPQITDRVIQALIDNTAECDYASNVLKRTYPRGLDVEAMFIDTLQRIGRLARTQVEREHVTVLPRSDQKNLFLVCSVEDTSDNSDLRWTVDTEADLCLTRALFEELDLSNKIVEYKRILDWIRSHPELSKINAGIETWTPV